MKRLLIIVAAASLLLSANVAMASVVGTAHQFGTATYGICQVCHVPHAAGGAKRLWRVPVAFAPNGTWANSTVGVLCGTCHNGGTGASWTNNAAVGGVTADQTDGVKPYATVSHKRTIATLTGGVHDALAGGQGKPYTTTWGAGLENGLIECTSCHNPHDATVRPFLRPGLAAGSSTSISGVCADCHNRYNKNVGTLNTQTWNGATVSMHPVDVAYSDNASNGVTTFRATPDAALTRLVPGLSGWSLGGKFQTSATGGVISTAPGSYIGTAIGCQTCHAVHNPNTGQEGELHLLAIDNVGTGGALLCEGCHGGPANATNVGTGADHPIDRTITPTVTIDLWYNSASDGSSNARYERHVGSLDWPRSGLQTHATTAGMIVCVSCHSAHAGRPTHNLTRRGGPVNDLTGDFCLSCHSDASPVGHHSNSANWATSAVKCTDCHGASPTAGAHNGFGFTRNGPWVTGPDNSKSQLCVSCHLGGTSDPLYGNLHSTGTGPGAPNPNSIPNGYLGAANSADGTTSRTHFLGTFTDGSNSINTKKTTWNGVGFSKYGGSETHGLATDTTATPEMICESCHSLLGNMGRPGNTYLITPSSSSGYMNNLLLQDYKDDGAPGSGVGGNSSNAAAAVVGSGFCIGCHNQKLPVAGAAAGTVADSNDTDKTTVPASMHPMTNWSITKAQDAGRTPTSLITGAGSYADNASRTVVYPATDKMTCDTCHRPHNAAGGATFATGDGTWNAVTGRGSQVISVILEKAGPTSGKYDALCQDCHAY